MLAAEAVLGGDGGREAERRGRMRRSSTLAAGLRRDIGRYEGPWSMGLTGLWMGMMMPFFKNGGDV